MNESDEIFLMPLPVLMNTTPFKVLVYGTCAGLRIIAYLWNKPPLVCKLASSPTCLAIRPNSANICFPCSVLLQNTRNFIMPNRTESRNLNLIACSGTAYWETEDVLAKDLCCMDVCSRYKFSKIDTHQFNGWSRFLSGQIVKQTEAAVCFESLLEMN